MINLCLIKNNQNIQMNWICKHTWKKASVNTLWCLLGCSIGDFGTIYFFQVYPMDISTLNIMILAIINGLITSIILETIILLKQMSFKQALTTALGMSLISMISMELAMNLTDYLITGGAVLNLTVIPIMLLAEEKFMRLWVQTDQVFYLIYGELML